jgi:plasmid maintenance system antidote protein VapI
MDKENLREIFLAEKKEWIAKAKAEIRARLEEFMKQKNMSSEELGYMLGVPSSELYVIFNGNGNVSLETIVALVMGSGNVLQVMPYDAQNEIKYQFLDVQKEKEFNDVDEEEYDEDSDIIEEDYADWSRDEVVEEIQVRNLEDMCELDEDCTDDLRQVLMDDDATVKAEAEENAKEDNNEEKSDTQPKIVSLMESIGKFLDENPILKNKLKETLLK